MISLPLLGIGTAGVGTYEGFQRGVLDFSADVCWDDTFTASECCVHGSALLFPLDARYTAAPDSVTPSPATHAILIQLKAGYQIHRA